MVKGSISKNDTYFGNSVTYQNLSMSQKIITNEDFPSFQKLLSMNYHFFKCATSLKCIRRWLTTVTLTPSLFLWSLWKRFTFSERNKFKFKFKWYIITHYSRSGWNTHMRFEFKGLHAWKLSAMFKVVTSVILFQTRCWFDFLFTIATVRRIGRQS